MAQGPPPLRARRRHVALCLVVLCTTILSGCTFHSGQQAEVDHIGSRFRLYIYQKPSYLLLALRDYCKSEAGTKRETWGRCSLTFLRNEVDVGDLAQVDWNHFTEGGKWSDYTGAIAEIDAGGTRTDGSGQKYTNRCATGDHAAFSGDYNWTHREDADGHCKRGQYPAA